MQYFNFQFRGYMIVLRGVVLDNHLCLLSLSHLYLVPVLTFGY